MTRVAIVTCVAFRPVQRLAPLGNQTRYTGDVLRLRQYVSSAVALGASLDAVGSVVDRIAITAFLHPSQRQALTQGGWCVRDFTPRQSSEATGKSSLGIDMLPFYRPLYSQQQSKVEGRPWLQPTQPRTDGAATYYKLVAWTMTCYSRVLMVDADVTFRSNPDTYIANPKAPYFAAVPKVADRAYTGFNSHVMCLTPDRNLFRQLLAKAVSGQYFAYTNGEQDVLETVFTAETVPRDFPLDYHYHMRPTPRIKASPPRLQSNGSAAISLATACMVDEAIDRSLLPYSRKPCATTAVIVASDTAHGTGNASDVHRDR